MSDGKGIERAGEVCLKCVRGASFSPAGRRPSSVQDTAKRQGRKQGTSSDFDRELVCEGLDRWIIQLFGKYSYLVSCQKLEEKVETALLFICKG